MKQKNENLKQLRRAVTTILAFVIFICSLLLIKNAPWISVTVFVCSLIIIVERLNHYFRREKKLMEYMAESPTEDGLQNDESFFKSMNPIVGVRIDGTIGWYNSAFKDLFGIIGDKKITEIIPEINVREVYSDNGNQTIIIKIGEDTYNIRASVKRKSSPDHTAIILYMDKVTELVETREALRKSQKVVAHIVIDNYDEAIADVDDEERFEIIALLDKNVIGWAQDAG